MRSLVRSPSSVYSTSFLNIRLKYSRYLAYLEVFLGTGYIFMTFRVQYISPLSRNVSECDEWQEYSFKYSSSSFSTF